MLKLMIDAPELTENVTMLVGKLEIPLTREQLVQMLFGDEWEIRRVDDAPQLKRKYTKRLGAPTPTKALPPGPSTSTRAPAGELLGMVQEALARGPLGMHDLRTAIEARHPGAFEGKRQEYLAGALARFTVSKTIVRTGKKGSFLYSTGKQSTTTTTPERKQSNGKAMARRAAPGEPTIADMVRAVLAQQKKPVASGAVQQLVEKKYPDALVGRHHSTVASTLLSLTKMKLVVKSGKSMKYLYALAKNWKEVMAKRAAKTEKSRKQSGKALAAKHIARLAAKKKSEPVKHVNGTSHRPAFASEAAEMAVS